MTMFYFIRTSKMIQVHLHKLQLVTRLPD